MQFNPEVTPEIYSGGSGSTLVLMHGFGGTWRQWKPVLKQLEKHHRVIAATLPGHVGGIPMTEPASPVSISRAFAQQLRGLGIKDAHFVGQSLGGWMVWEMARFGLARSSLGLSPAGTWRDEEQKRLFMRRARSMFKLLPYVIPLMKLAVGVPALRKKVLANEMEHGERMPAAEARDALSRISKLTIGEEYMDENIRPMEPLPADCKTPLRVVWACEDKGLPYDQYGAPLVELLGLDSAVMLPGCGHNPLWDDPDAVVKAILDFTLAVDAKLAR